MKIMKKLSICLMLLPVFFSSPCISKPRIALVLSGGAAKGLAHLGVLEQLEEIGIHPDIIVGTSMGAIIGGAYSEGMSVEEIKEAVNIFTKEDQFSKAKLSLLDKNVLGLYDSRVIIGFIKRYSDDRRIEDMPIKFVAIATNLKDGKVEYFTRGDLATCIMASSAVPGIFTPVKIGGDLYCDGGLIENLGVEIARRMGADLVIASDVGWHPLTDLPKWLNDIFSYLKKNYYDIRKREKLKKEITSYFDVLYNASIFWNVEQEFTDKKNDDHADVVITPIDENNPLYYTAFEKIRYFETFGIKTTEKAIPDILKKIETLENKKGCGK